MTSHGLRTVSSSRFGSANDQALFFITIKEEIPGSVVSWACQHFQYEWDGLIIKGIQLPTFDRRGRAAMLTC